MEVFVSYEICIKYHILFDCNSCFFCFFVFFVLFCFVCLSHKTSHLVVKSATNVGKPFDPRSRPLARRQEHFDGILMAEQSLSQGSVETFNNSLVFDEYMFCGFLFLWSHFPWTCSQGRLAASEATSKRCACKSIEKLRNFSSVLKPEAQLLCSGWPRRQWTGCICKPCGHEAACREARIEGQLGGPSWETISRILVEKCNAAWVGRSAKGPVWSTIAWLFLLRL